MLLGLGRPDDGRPDRAEREIDAALLLVDDQAEAGDRDHHRVAGADLGKAPRAAELSPARTDDQLIGCDRRLLRAGEKRLPGQRSFTASLAAQHDIGVVGRQHRQRVPGRRAGSEVAAHSATVTDLRRTDRARRLHQWLEGRHFPDDGGVGHARAEEDLAILLPDGRKLAQPADVDDGGRPQAAEVHVDHQVGAARQCDRLGPVGLHRQGFVERLRHEHVHRGATTLSAPPWSGGPEAAPARRG